MLYGFSVSGKNYSVISLAGANLIDDNRYQVYRSGFLIDVLNVFYNFNDGEQMVVETAILYTSGSLTVKKYAVDDLLDNRTTWGQWTDSIYQIENTSYAKTVANIYRRLFNEAHEKFDCVALNAVKFNDIILFKYVYVKDFYVLNCSWNLDENKTTITLGRSYYKDATSTVPGDDNVPPIVLAGNDIYLTDLQNTAALTAVAYDPDGFIVNQQWTKTSGVFGDIIDTPFALNTALQNLTGDYYTYQIEVTDNDGATAVDSVNVIRSKDYAVNLNVIYSNETETAENHEVETKYQIVVDPALPSDFILNITGFLKGIFTVSRWMASAYVIIEKNGAVLEEYVIDANITLPLILNYIATDVIFITIRVNAMAGTLSGEVYSFATGSMTLNLGAATFVNGVGTITNLPLEVVLQASVYE